MNTNEPLFGFETALARLRKGAKLRRAGWNGWNGIPINANTAEATGIPQGTVCRFLPYLMFFTADGAFVPWLASQTDILSCDWEEA